MNLEEQILKLVEDKPGVMAKQLADKLSISRKEVNAILYGRLSSVLKRDDSYHWFPVAAQDAAISQTNKHEEITLNRPALVKHGAFRGSSLFTYEDAGEDVELTYNSNHPFFKNVYAALNDEGKAAVDALAGAFATVASSNYDLADQIEDLIHKWGRELS